MSQERWVQKITAMPGEYLRPTFYQTGQQAVAGSPEANYRLLVVFENDDHGLEPGVYVQTNLTAHGVNSLPHTRRGIGQQVCLALMDDEQSHNPSTRVTGVSYLDGRSAIELRVVAETGAGGIVYQVLRANVFGSNTRLDEAIRGMDPGNYSITPLSRFKGFLDRIRQGKFGK